MSTEIRAAPSPSISRQVGLLLRKEWAVFTLRDRIYVLGVFFLASLQTVSFDGAYLIVGVALAVVLFLYVPIVEWYQESDPMLLSFPIGRDAVVVARYCVALLAGGVAGGLWALTGRLLLPLLAAERTAPGFFMTLEGGLTFFILVLMVAVLFLPLFFGFGLIGGGMAFLVSCALLPPLAYGASALAGATVGGAPFSLISPVGLVEMATSELLSRMGLVGTLTGVLVGAAIVAALSLRLSQLLFRRRDF